MMTSKMKTPLSYSYFDKISMPVRIRMTREGARGIFLHIVFCSKVVAQLVTKAV